ncbi:DUF6326 family protein [Azospirillum rugosum]|uniref:Uncharacterized protein YaaW (UPF0174 family) n=1 Tax=Azospirillum rugosum TaxID=416170 RepID=A0ABS4SE63_9PROT|nr:DUF6326 family protein [Azospirillum rugosum]MBP2290867.1 uncharacterized protein YaaW (UPF0174 family) [Azospirillum rugosum]MDQ0529734.1 uncharacterized protein YaaW (UPF0174 family) [Azospirillum rugosum]
MDSITNATGAPTEGKRLSLLWVFAMLNYLYCDIVTLMDPNLLKQFLSGTVEGMQIDQMFLLVASVLMEIPIVMVLLSRVLTHRANRLANIIAGAIMTAVQLATLLSGTPTPYYVFFSIVEIATTLFIVQYAWRWTAPQSDQSDRGVQPSRA